MAWPFYVKNIVGFGAVTNTSQTDYTDAKTKNRPNFKMTLCSNAGAKWP